MKGRRLIPVLLLAACASPSTPSLNLSKREIVHGALECCQGDCTSEKAVAPIFDGGRYFCPEESVPVGSCLRDTCAPLIDCSANGFQCCEYSCAGAAAQAICMSGHLVCPSNHVNSVGCPNGRCGAKCDAASRPACCRGECNGDVPMNPLCEDQTWRCPFGSISESECSDAGSPFCRGGPIRERDGGP